MKLARSIAIASLCILTSSSTYSMQNIFYFLRYKDPSMQPAMQKEMTSLRDHSNSINAIITQSYHIDKAGVVSGYINDEMMMYTRTHHINTYLLVTNAGFNREDTHVFLHNPKAQKDATQSLLKLCHDNTCQGIQMDFENVAVEDKAELSTFFISFANLMHQQHLTVSFAVVPALTDGKQISNYQQKKYDHWSGAYDLAALSKVADFITLMTYDQHTDGTTPGPNADIRWVEATLKHSLQFVPANKLSLGIATYSLRWYVGGKDHLGVKLAQISYSDALAKLKENQANLQWSDKGKFHFAIYDHNWLYQYLYLEDAASFKARYALARKYKLHGVSVFNIGIEDPAIWKKLKMSFNKIDDTHPTQSSIRVARISPP